MSLRNRPSLRTETVEILRLAWTGEPFSYAGRRHSITDARVHPGSGLAATHSHGRAQRAGGGARAQIGDGYMGAWPASLQLYVDALVALAASRPAARSGACRCGW